VVARYWRFAAVLFFFLFLFFRFVVQGETKKQEHINEEVPSKIVARYFVTDSLSAAAASTRRRTSPAIGAAVVMMRVTMSAGRSLG
jgi:hypothetical protein